MAHCCYVLFHSTLLQAAFDGTLTNFLTTQTSFMSHKLCDWLNPVAMTALSHAAFIPGYNGNIFGVARDLTTLYHVDLAAPVPTATAVPSGGERRGHTTWSGESGYPATFVLPGVALNGCVWLVLCASLCSVRPHDGVVRPCRLSSLPLQTSPCLPRSTPAPTSLSTMAQPVPWWPGPACCPLTLTPLLCQQWR